MKPIRLPGPPRFLGIALLLGTLQVLPEMPGVRVQAAEQPLDLLLNFDRRTATSANAVPRAAALPAERLNAEARLRDRLPALQLDRHPILDSPKWIASREGFLTGPDGTGPAMANATVARQPVAPNDPQRVVKAFLDEHAGIFGHDAAALDAAVVRRDYTTAHSGLRTTVWQQEHQGIEVFEAVFIAHTTKEGELVNVASQFVPDPAEAAARGEPVLAAAGAVSPKLTAEEAITAASKTCRPTGARDSSRPGSADFQSAVSRVSNLRGHRSFRTRWHSPAPADWKSATRQVGNLRYSFALLALLLLATLIPQLSTAHAQQFSIPWHTIDGGGGTSTGGVYSVSGTIGQPDAGGPMTGGTFSLAGGFWALPTVIQTPDAPTLSITNAAPGWATLWWKPSTGTNWILQERPSLSAGGWSNAPSGSTNPIVVPASVPTKFYRLFKP